ncbi:GNAT family N-acetyltransferase [Candidatus Bathyarchaeota archaeon]|nr:GNAT family N-acetyltransferase [Candidatus Bathyarchaeota archaeon]
MDGIAIRRCTRDELKAVMHVNELTLPENYPQFFYESILERFPESFLIAEDLAKQKIIGYIMFRVERGMEPGIKFVKKGHLVSIAVLKGYQGKKIGKQLLIEGLKRVRTYSVDIFVLEVRISNEKAITMYKRLNFKIKKTLESYYRDGENAYYMVLHAKHFKPDG